MRAFACAFRDSRDARWAGRVVMLSAVGSDMVVEGELDVLLVVEGIGENRRTRS